VIAGAFNPSFPSEKLIYQLRAFEQLNFTQQNYSITCGAEARQKKKKLKKEKQRQACTDSQSGFCGCVALSKAFKLWFCSYKHVF